MVLDDAATRSQFSEDPYIRQRQARSILCLPLTNQAKLIGILYLENNLAPRVFAPDRTAVLKLLASQAAISLENTRLYHDLAEREAKIRRLVDANIIGIFIWDIEGQILEANDAFLHMVGYDREDLVRGRLRRTELTPPEWRELDKRAWGELNSTGMFQPFEKEYFRKDGSRVPVLIGAALFKEGGDQGLAFVLDLTERKRVEEALTPSTETEPHRQLDLRRDNDALPAIGRTSVTGSGDLIRCRAFQVDESMWEPFTQRTATECEERVQEAVRQKKILRPRFETPPTDGTIKWVEGTRYHVFSPRHAEPR